MRHITLNSAVLALLISSPVMWAAANGQADPKTALLRYLAALAFASIGLAVVNGLLEAYRSGNGAPQRRDSDLASEANPSQTGPADLSTPALAAEAAPVEAPATS